MENKHLSRTVIVEKLNQTIKVVETYHEIKPKREHHSNGHRPPFVTSCATHVIPALYVTSVEISKIERARIPKRELMKISPRSPTKAHPNRKTGGPVQASPVESHEEVECSDADPEEVPCALKAEETGITDDESSQDDPVQDSPHESHEDTEYTVEHDELPSQLVTEDIIVCDDESIPVEGATIGIDFGTTGCSVGVWRDGVVEIVGNEFGNLRTTSCVTFNKDGYFVGCHDEDGVGTRGGSTVYDLRRLLGRSFSDVSVQVSW